MGAFNRSRAQEGGPKPGRWGCCQGLSPRSQVVPISLTQLRWAQEATRRILRRIRGNDSGLGLGTECAACQVDQHPVLADRRLKLRKFSGPSSGSWAMGTLLERIRKDGMSVTGDSPGESLAPGKCK